jgi:hypothetical protein
MFSFWDNKKTSLTTNNPTWYWSEQPVLPKEVREEPNVLQEINDTLKRIEKLLEKNNE